MFLCLGCGHLFLQDIHSKTKQQSFWYHGYPLNEATFWPIAASPDELREPTRSPLYKQLDKALYGFSNKCGTANKICYHNAG